MLGPRRRRRARHHRRRLLGDVRVLLHPLHCECVCMGGGGAGCKAWSRWGCQTGESGGTARGDAGVALRPGTTLPAPAAHLS